MKKKPITKAAVLILAVVAFYLIIPRVCTSDYTIMIINIGMIYALIAYSVSIMLGLGGYLSFAGVSFMGCGAFLIANLTTGRFGFSVSPIAALLLVIPFAVILGFLLGLVLLRLKGTYFTFSTIALVQVTYTFFNNFKPLFGGPDGISGIPTTQLFGQKLTTYSSWFPVLLAIVVLAGLLVERLRSTQLGRSLAAIRDNETAARTLGVHVYMTKVIAFTVSAVLAAFAGGLYAMHGQFVSSDMFTYSSSAQYIIMAMLGGVNNTVGVFLGALLVEILPQGLRAFERYFQLFWGICIILLMVFMPSGLAGMFESLQKRIKAKFRGSTAKGQTAGNLEGGK